MGVLSKNFVLGDDEELWHYNCLDCVRTREVGEVELETIAAQGLDEVHAFQQELLWPVLAAMNRGVRVSTRERERLALHLTEEIQRRHDWLKKVLGHPLNPASVKQMRALFYDDFKQPVVMKRGKAGAPPTVSCDDEALTTIAKREPLLKPITNCIKQIRSLKVLYATFVMMPLDVDGRMRTSYNICGTETFRFSSSQNAFGTGGNLQNVSLGGPDEDMPEFVLPNIRKMFVPDAGFTFFDTDLSKADLRIVVWEADEREMKAMLAEGRDPYIETAREYYHDASIEKFLPGTKVINPKYDLFKRFGHGTHYLGTPVGLARRIGLTVHEAERTQKWYLGKYAAIKAWQDRFKEEVTRTRRVTNAFGYVRVFFGRVDDAMLREAIAWKPQSTVAILINKIWVKIHRNVKPVQVLMQVHDSLAGQFPTAIKAQCLEAIKEQTKIIIPYDDPLIIPVGIKTSDVSWGECG